MTAARRIKGSCEAKPCRAWIMEDQRAPAQARFRKLGNAPSMVNGTAMRWEAKRVNKRDGFGEKE